MPQFHLCIRWAKCLCLVALLGGPLASAQGPPASPRERFDQVLLPAVERAVRQPVTQEGGDLAWGSAYQLEALVLMFDTTHDAKYAERAVQLADWITKSRDDRLGLRDVFRDRVVPAWGSTVYTKGKRYVWAVHTGMITAPMARFAAVVRGDPALKERWGKDADRLLEIAEEAVAAHDDDYREGPRADEGHLHSRFLGTRVPLNMQNALARAWLAIDDATSEPKYRERVTRLARFIQHRLRPTDDGAYVWAYWPPLEGGDESFEDVSHAAINVDFMTLCHEHGIVFTREDMRRLEKTLSNRVMRTDGQISDTVGGGDKFDRHRSAVLCWARLGRHFPKARERLISFSLAPGISQGDTALPLGIAYLGLRPVIKK